MVDVVELERRMRPGAWSDDGFLGDDERLEEVLAADEATLVQLGITCEEIVEPLSLLVDAHSVVLLESPELESARLDNPEWVAHVTERRAAIEARFGHVESTGLWSARVGGRYEVEVVAFFGIQACPWGRDQDGPACGSDNHDWRIRDTVRSLELQGPSLITHLISEHRFFEGFESPYRVDPRALAELLRLGPYGTA